MIIRTSSLDYDGMGFIVLPKNDDLDHIGVRYHEEQTKIRKLDIADLSKKKMEIKNSTHSIKDSW